MDEIQAGLMLSSQMQICMLIFLLPVPSFALPQIRVHIRMYARTSACAHTHARIHRQKFHIDTHHRHIKQRCMHTGRRTQGQLRTWTHVGVGKTPFSSLEALLGPLASGTSLVRASASMTQVWQPFHSCAP